MAKGILSANQIVSANQLHVQTLNATVNVSLLELDQMRAGYAGAIEIAKKLESQQGQIKIVVVQKHAVRKYDEYAGRYYDKDQFDELSTEFKNLDDILGELTIEAEKRVAKAHKAVIAGYDSQVINLTKANESHSTEGVKYRNKIKGLEERNFELDQAVKAKDAEIKDLQCKLDQLQEIIEIQHMPLIEETEDLKKKYKKLIQDKTFWGWVTKALDK